MLFKAGMAQAFTNPVGSGFSLEGFIPRACREVIVVWFNVGCQVDHLTSRKLAGGIQHYGFTMVIGALIVTWQANQVDIFAALCCVGGRNFIFWEDGLIRTFWDTRPTIDAGIWVDVIPGPFVNWFARDNAFYRADFDAPCVSQA
jgi:hypothetical protein